MPAVLKPSARAAVGASELFQYLRDGLPHTRSELAALTGLARASVASRVDTLMELGLVTVVGDAQSTGGRPSAQIALHPLGRVVVAADFGASHSSIALHDLTGRILEVERQAIAIADGPEPVLGSMVDSVERLLSRAGLVLDDVAAVAMGLPGPIEHATGRPSNPPIMPGWDGFPVPEWVQNHIPVPVLVENDVNIMALGERALHFADVHDLVFVKIATGLGAGIISGGGLQRGAGGIAGDIGHIRVERAAAELCRCGNYGCLGAVASGASIARTLRGQGLDVTTADDVLAAVRSGNPTAIAAIRQAGRDVGEVLTACISFINPAVIVVGGSIGRAGEHLLAGLREVVYSRSSPLATRSLAILQSQAGADAALAGAAELAIQQILSPAGIAALIESGGGNGRAAQARRAG